MAQKIDIQLYNKAQGVLIPEQMMCYNGFTDRHEVQLRIQNVVETIPKAENHWGASGLGWLERRWSGR